MTKNIFSRGSVYSFADSIFAHSVVVMNREELPNIINTFFGAGRPGHGDGGAPGAVGQGGAGGGPGGNGGPGQGGASGSNSGTIQGRGTGQGNGANKQVEWGLQAPEEEQEESGEEQLGPVGKKYESQGSKENILHTCVSVVRGQKRRSLRAQGCVRKQARKE